MYQWKKDGNNLTGQTNDLLVLDGVTPSDQAAYTVGVTNGFGGVLSCTANLYIVDRTVGQRDPQMNPTICPNNMVNVVRQQRDGKLVLGGSFTSIGSGVNHHMVSPAIAPTGPGTRASAWAPPCQGAQISALELQPDGRIVIGGTFVDYGGIPRLYIARLLPDGGTGSRLQSRHRRQRLGLMPSRCSPTARC